jgi:Endonuclease-reverse transcriptase
MADVFISDVFKTVFLLLILQCSSTNSVVSSRIVTANTDAHYYVNSSADNAWNTADGCLVHCSLWRIAYTATWARPLNTVPFRFRRSPSPSGVLFASLLLLAGDVEVNPGPTATTDIVIGSLNTRPAIKHAAEVCDLVVSHSLDVAMLCETWTRHGAHDAVNRDFVPDGYDVINKPRDGGRPGGGLATLFKSELNVREIPSDIKPTTFDLLVTTIGEGSEQILLANIYRPPSTNINIFFNELADLLDELSGRRVIFAGDFNCPGETADTINSRLDVLLSCYNQVVVNEGPTHVHFDGGQNKLDLMFENDADRYLSDVSTVSAGFSDHRLVIARLRHRRPPAIATQCTYRDFKRVDMLSFRSFLLTLPSWTTPAADPDVASMQLDTDLRCAVNKFVPLRTHTRRLGKSKNPWMTPECVARKRYRRRLEGRFVRSRTENDRIAYRRACREANKLFRDARSSYIQQTLNEARDNPRQLWRSVSRLLHPGQQRTWFDGLDTDRLANSVSDFFINKLKSVKLIVTSGLRDAADGCKPTHNCLPPKLQSPPCLC